MIWSKFRRKPTLRSPRPVSGRRLHAIEMLEGRCLLSVTVENHVLTVIGTDGPDFITIAPAATGTDIEVNLNGSNFLFAQSDISACSIDAALGNDRVTVGRAIPLGCGISGGLGNDSLEGGGGNDWISGGPGKDIIIGGGGNDSIHGDESNDLLIGGDGDDTVDGNEGNDILITSRGHDVLRPGIGSNSLRPGDLIGSLTKITIHFPQMLSNAVNSGHGQSDPLPGPQGTDITLDNTLGGSVTTYGTLAFNDPPCTGTMSFRGTGTVRQLSFLFTMSSNSQFNCRYPDGGVQNGVPVLLVEALAGRISLEKLTLAVRFKGLLRTPAGLSKGSGHETHAITEITTDVS